MLQLWVHHEIACRKKLLTVNTPYLFKYSESQYFLYFATKRHWKQNSRLNDIKQGLIWVRDNHRILESIAFPALGCGLGNLDFKEVKKLFYLYLEDLPLKIEIYKSS